MNDQTKSKLKPKTGAEKDLNLKSIRFYFNQRFRFRKRKQAKSI